ncbi:MAG: transglycosylase SLT domain-containing protein [Polyangiaceae bacterium]
MAAPESAMAHVQTAVFGGETKPHAKTRVAAKPQPKEKAKVAGEESNMLSQLRTSHAPSRYTEEGDRRDRRMPRYARVQDLSEGSRDAYAEVEDEFDPTETAAISRLQLPDFNLPVTRQTLKYVRFFTKSDRGRDMFATWLKRSGKYQEMIQGELRTRHLPEDLLWVAMIESGFDPTAKSPAGAVGLWQFMPTTGAVYGLRQNRYVDQRKNAKVETLAAVHHLRDLYTRFGQWDLALAAYNMGYEQLLNRIDEVGTTDFTELVRQGALPTETSKYVPKIVAAAIVANNLERFGFDDVKIMQAVDGGEISVPPGTSIETVARAAGVSTSTIRKMNPDILGRTTPPGKADYTMLVPAETMSQTVAALPGLIRNAKDGIEGGDVLDPVDLLNPDGFRPADGGDDDTNLLSFLPKPTKKKPMRDPMDDDGSMATSKDAPRFDPDEEVRPKKGREIVIYRIVPGDTLIGVARDFGIDVDDVIRDNHLKPKEQLKEGGLLRLNVRTDLLDYDKKEERSDAHPAKRTKDG